MHCRTHGRKSAVALWMLVAVADLVLLVATVGVLKMLIIALALVVVAGGVVAARRMTRRPEATAEVARRRA